MVGKRQSARTRDHGADPQITEGSGSFFKQVLQRFPDICKMSLIIIKKQLVIPVKHSDLDRRGTDVHAQMI